MEQNNCAKEPIRVGVADKSPLVQAALKHLFSEDPRFTLVLVCSDGETYIEAVKTTELDVGVIGWAIPPGDGMYILDQLKAHDNSQRIVVYTGAEAEVVPAQVMAHGGAAFVSKSEQPEFLLDAVASVAEGRMIFPYLDVRKIHDAPINTLTKRELDVLSLIAAGHTNKQIAALEGVSPNTINFHVKNVYQKLGVNNRSQAVAVYLKS
jgi:two-component system, NarL family, nitrate/nitrite response regulator NarL